MNAKNFTVVLVEPQGALNIGSVCRVMANFGMGELRLVNPQADHLGDEARRMAVKAGGLLDEARVYPDLPSALEDCVLAVGTTRRFGKYREEVVLPEELASEAWGYAARGRVAMVFGREDRGLLTAELDLCQRLLTIPTEETLPSMNLAQAVAVCLYALRREVGEGKAEAASPRGTASVAEQEAMFEHMRRTLLDIEFLNAQNPDHILRTFRRVFARAELDPREVRVLQGLWSRIDWVWEELKKARKGEET